MNHQKSMREQLADAGYKPLEKDIQRDIVHLLSALGCTVLVTNAGVRRVVAQFAKERGERCGAVASPGVPDLLVSRASWPTGCWLGLEVKRPQGKLSPAQQRLEAIGMIVIVRSADDAARALQAFEEDIFGS